MANSKKRLATNVAGAFFVDSTCIDCDTCRQLAPETFKELGDYSSVFCQPGTEAQEQAALRALVACPTGSIGCEKAFDAKAALAQFPMLIEGEVYYCGFNSEKSYGANSYFVKHADGNWLIDSPRSTAHLLKAFELMGGIKYIFLTHRDDVADANEFAEHFKAERIIHRDELSALPEAEIVIETNEHEDFSADFRIICVPGHTKGHCLLLYKNKYLFSGDHLHFDRDSRHLAAFPDHCWYSWQEQSASMSRLAVHSFEWVLSGHGQSVCQSRDQNRVQLLELAETMKSIKR
ncbi:MAG: MBL fold metallo-hydrolase [Candidatus Obscuribacterales bacterium]|nr:MBL fold metallo-hydrolase [Candidatus Obscuribacterales bacterium]